MMLLGSRLAPPWWVGVGGGGWSQVGTKKQGISSSKFFSSELEGIELRYLVFSISFWTSAKFIYMMLVGSKLAHPRGHKLEHRNKENQLQNSETERTRALIFCYLASLCGPLSVLLIWFRWSQNWPHNRVTSWNRGTKKTNFKILLLWNWKG